LLVDFCVVAVVVDLRQPAALLLAGITGFLPAETLLDEESAEQATI